jgi:DNA-binding NtrC family response regulator
LIVVCSEATKAMPAVLVSVSNRDLGRQLTDFLYGMGAAVVLAGPALESALQRNNQVEVLVTDLPCQGGAEIVARLAARQPALKALFISGEPDYINRACWPQPWLEFIEKPFAWSELKRRFDRLMQLRV